MADALPQQPSAIAEAVAKYKPRTLGKDGGSKEKEPPRNKVRNSSSITSDTQQ